MIKVPFVNLPLQHNTLKQALLDSIGELFDSGQYILGPAVESFEIAFAALCGSTHTVGVDNGTNALLLSLKSLGIGAGDEVITAANSFLASASCIALVGARPVLADVQNDFTIDPEYVESVITSRTKAIIPVHITGRPAQMDSLMALARKHGVHVVEDAAQAVGATYDNKPVGSFGIAGCFSFHPLKILSAVGDGGAITTSNTELYKKLIKARNHGLKNRDECEFWSINARLDAIQAQILHVKMACLKKWVARRRAIADKYGAELGDLVTVPEECEKVQSVYQTYVIMADKRDLLQQKLMEQGIDTKVHYPVPIHLQQPARPLGYKAGDFPVTESQSTRILSLPIYPELTDEQVDLVIRAIKSFYLNEV